MGWLLRMAGRLAVPTRPGAFRLWLAMLVFVHHLSSLGLGPYAVDVFFVLSGYWIERMWEERYRHARTPYLTYLVSRLWRLAPTMLLVSVVTVLLLRVIGQPWATILAADPLHLLASSTVLLGYAWLPYAPVGAAWSLDVEMQFYLIAPAIALLVRRRWPAVLAASAVISALAWTVAGPPTLPPYLLFFVIGMAAARTDWRPSPQLAAWSAALVLGGLLAIWATPLRPMLIGGADPLPLFRYNWSLNTVLALMTVPFALFTVRQTSDRDDRMMADLSYIIYLLHWVAMQWFFTVTGGFAERLAVAGTSLVIVPAAAWLIWVGFDRPVNRARGRWVARRLQREGGE